MNIRVTDCESDPGRPEPGERLPPPHSETTLGKGLAYRIPAERRCVDQNKGSLGANNAQPEAFKLVDEVGAGGWDVVA